MATRAQRDPIDSLNLTDVKIMYFSAHNINQYLVFISIKDKKKKLTRKYLGPFLSLRILKEPL